LDFIMAARVLLLMAFTGLFAAAWSSDSPEAATTTLAAHARRSKFKLVSEVTRSNRLASESRQAVTYSSEFDLSTVPLPERIPSGTYRVVDAQGRVGWVAIPADNQAAPTANEPERFYSTESAAERWYFIRIDAAPLIAVPKTGETALR
jgi:hypothetical protein